MASDVIQMVILNVEERAAVIDSSAPLTWQQEVIWHAPTPERHNIPPLIMRVVGDLDLDALEQALNNVVARHGVLRTAFRRGDADDRPVQVVAASASVRLSFLDFSRLASRYRSTEGVELISTEGRLPFDLAAPPLMRTGAIRLGPSEHFLWIVVHHIISDLWSMKLLRREITQWYSALVRRAQAPLPPLSMQYADYARWQRTRLEDGVVQDRLAHWRRQLEGVPRLALRPNPAAGAANDAHVSDVTSDVVPRDLSAAIRTLAREEGLTPFMALLAGFFVLLQHYSGEQNLAIESSLANRDWADCESLLGMFATTMALRLDLAGCADVHTLLRQVRDTCFEAYRHQHLPFRQASMMASERTGTPLTRPSVLFAMQSAPVQTPTFANLTVKPSRAIGVTLFADTGVDSPCWDQVWQIWDRGSTFQIVVVHRRSLFSREAIVRMCADFQFVLGSIAAGPVAERRTRSIGALVARV